MSERPSQQGRPREFGREGDQSKRQRTSPQPQQYAQPWSQSASTAPSPTIQRQQQGSARGFELPPLPQATSATSANFSPLPSTRLAGVSSILNPTQADEPGQGRRRKASELESPSMSSAPALAPMAMGVYGTAPVPGHTAPSPLQLGDRPSRRTLTPRSPSLHKAASLGQLQMSTGTISAQQTPFPGSPRHRSYAIEPGISGAPPLPTPPAAMRAGYGFPGPTPSSEAARRASMGVNRSKRAASGSASPSTSYSSYSQADQTSPATQYAFSGQYSSAEGAGTGTASAPGSVIGSERQHPMTIPISSSSGQNVYQMMTLETTSGTVQLPVDVQAASRVADEKRRRNAGASARFRQRRKEKEKEATTTIGKLEQQVKELGEDADFYRRERDYLSGVLMQVPGAERHFPRPPSPRRRRSSITTTPGPSGTAGLTYGGAQESMPHSPHEGRSVRRRTSTLSLPVPPPTAIPIQGVPYQGGYGQQPYGAPLASQSPHGLQQATVPLPSPLTRAPLSTATTLPPMQHAPPGPPQLMQAPPQTGPWNPYAMERRPPGQPGPRDNR